MNVLFENEGFIVILLHTWIVNDLNGVVLFLILRVAKFSGNVKARCFGGELLLMVEVSDLSWAQRFEGQPAFVMIYLRSWTVDMSLRNPKESIFNFIVSSVVVLW